MDATGSAWRGFSYDVNKATVSLMYALQGIEHVRNSCKPIPDDSPGHPAVSVPPSLSGMSALPSLIGVAAEDLLKVGGQVEQMAFRGWIEEVYNILWNHRYRKELRDAAGISGRFQPEITVMGDLGGIRNFITHPETNAAKDVEKCEILKWFMPSDPIVLRMHHVLDFLNQMSFMDFDGFGEHDTFKSSGWSNVPGLRNSNAVPKLISIRPWTDVEDGFFLYAVSVVFENGIHANAAISFDVSRFSLSNGKVEIADASEQEKCKLFNMARIAYGGDVIAWPNRFEPGPEYFGWSHLEPGVYTFDDPDSEESGKLLFPGTEVFAKEIYDRACAFPDGERRGRGIPSPPVRIRK